MEGEPIDNESKKEELGFILNRIQKNITERSLASGEENDSLVKKVKELRKKYLDFEKYELYHLLAGSTMKKSDENDPEKKFDFPGEDSVEKFIMDFED